MSGLLLCRTKEAKKPYIFDFTGIEITSLEELYYYCYNYYETLIDIFPMPNLLQWINDELELKEIVMIITKMKAKKMSSVEILLGFLQITDYYTDEELSDLKKKINNYEKMTSYQKLARNGGILIKFKKFKEALKYYNDLLEEEKNVEVFHNLGVIYMNLMQSKTAIQYFKLALDKEENINTIRQYAYALLLSKDYNSLIELLNKYLENYNDAQLWYIYGQYFEQIKEKEKALDAYYNVLKLDDSIFEVYQSCIYLLHENDMLKKAYKIISNIRKKHPYVYIVNIALYFELNNDYEKAIECLKEAMKIYPNEKDIYIYLAKLYDKQNNTKKAIEVINYAYKLDNQDPNIKFLIAHINKKLGYVNQYYKTIDQLILSFKYNYRTQIN